MDIRKDVIREASFDLRFLLNRNYRKKNALTFVANKYVLDLFERHYLARSIFSEAKSASRMEKILDINNIKGKPLLVDGYNVLITTESIFRGDKDLLVLCDDGIIRDLNAVFGKYKFNQATEISLNAIFNLIKENKPLYVHFFFDKQVSFSGKLAKMTEKLMKSHNICGKAILTKHVDFEIVKIAEEINGVVATSDGIIIDRINKIIDLPYFILNK